MNKYSFPAYMQYNIDTRYAFSGFWKGWELQVIYFYKDAVTNTEFFNTFFSLRRDLSSKRNEATDCMKTTNRTVPRQSAHAYAYTINVLLGTFPFYLLLD